MGGTVINPVEIWLLLHKKPDISDQRLELERLRSHLEQRRAAAYTTIRLASKELDHCDLFERAINEAEKRITVQRATGR